MSLAFFKKRVVGSALVATFALSLLVLLYVGFYTRDAYLTDQRISVFPKARRIIFPKSFEYAKSPSALYDYYHLYLHEDDLMNDEPASVMRYGGGGNCLSPDMLKKDFDSHAIDVFDVNGLENCQQDVKNLEVGVAEPLYLSGDIETLVDTFLWHLSHDEPFFEFKDRMEADLLKSRQEGTISQKFYKFSGSSVWLKEHGVHMMVSRAVYSQRSNRLDPDISFMYAQLFDAEWKELKGTELVLPIINENNEKVHRSVQFPRFFPVPFYHHEGTRFLGPEDPRMLLYHGEHGLEPMIACNSDRRMVDQDEAVNKHEEKVKYKFERTMFVVFPFRQQRGKFNVLGSNANFNHILYTKAIELARDLMAGGGAEKNWTPMLSHNELQEDGYHKNIYFVYRWQKMEVLQCRLNEEHQGKAPCDFVYKRSKGTGRGIGPLRGGTEMLNVRDVVPKKYLHFDDQKEIWIGFPRAHISGCGCGKDMYRPNFSVITKEGDDFKISQLSSYMGLNVDVKGWIDPNVLCVHNEHNALIPNGVSDWSFDGEDDYVTLSLSVADNANVVVQIKNLFKTIVKHTDVFKFDKSRGYNEKVVECALDFSKDFCKAYGSEMERLGKTPPKED